MRTPEDPTRCYSSEARDDWEEREEAIRFSSVNRELAAKAARLERELEQERQDRVQAEKDVCRALGERNDARKELEQVRQQRDESIRLLADAVKGWKEETR